MTATMANNVSTGDEARRGRFERFIFRFMGPPEVGDLNAPIRAPQDRPVELCGRCRRPFDEHEVVRRARLTYTRCPGEPPR